MMLSRLIANQIRFYLYFCEMGHDVHRGSHND